MYLSIKLQKLITLANQKMIDPELIDVSVEKELFVNMLLGKLDIEIKQEEIDTIVKSEDDEVVLEKEAKIKPFYTHWRNAEAVFQVKDLTMKRGLVPGLEWIGELEGYSKKMAMVKVDLLDPELASFNLTQEDFEKKRKKFYSTGDLQKLWGFSTNNSIYRRFDSNEKLKLGKLWKFPVDIANEKQKQINTSQLELEKLRIV